MKKRGKFEKQVQAPQEKQSKGIKDPILHTYMTSLLSLVLCCTMFFGTTMAWFTDEVTVGGNQIHVGTLSMSVGVVGKNRSVTELENNDTTPVFPTEPYKPGDKVSTTLQVANTGEMEFDYRLKLAVELDECRHADDTAMTNADVMALAEYLNVSVRKDGKEEEIGTLAEILTGDKVVVSGTLDQGDAPDEFEIMLELVINTPSDYMGQILKLNIRMVAYQQSDAATVVASETELVNALADEDIKHIVIADNVVITEPVAVTGTRVISLDGGTLLSNYATPVVTAEDGTKHRNYMFVLEDGANLTINGHDTAIDAGSGLILVPKNKSAKIVLNGGQYNTPDETGNENALINIARREESKATVDVTMNKVTYTDGNGWTLLCRGLRDGGGTLNLTVDKCTITAGHGFMTAEKGEVVLTNSNVSVNHGLALMAASGEGVLVDGGEYYSASPTATAASEDPNTFYNVMAVSHGGKLTVKNCKITHTDDVRSIAILPGGGEVELENSSYSKLVEHHDHDSNDGADFKWTGGEASVICGECKE